MAESLCHSRLDPVPEFSVSRPFPPRSLLSFFHSSIPPSVVTRSLRSLVSPSTEGVNDEGESD